MSKSILLIDTPKSCSECKRGSFNWSYYFDEKLNRIGSYKLRCENVNPTPTTVMLVECSEKSYNTNRHPQCPLQDTTELLEELKVLGSIPLEDIVHPHLSMSEENITKVQRAYNKLYKELGGKE